MGLLDGKRPWKSFIEPSFEAQALEITTEISETKEVVKPVDELVIDSKTEETQTPKHSKKKTATDIHLEIKTILSDSPDLDGHMQARSVLFDAFKSGYGGKRLKKWRSYLKDYFDDMESRRDSGG